MQAVQTLQSSVLIWDRLFLFAFVICLHKVLEINKMKLKKRKLTKLLVSDMILEQN